MKSRKKTLVLAALAVCAAAAIAVPVVEATTATAVAVKVSSSLKSNTVTTLTGSVGGTSVTSTCTASSTVLKLSTAVKLGPWVTSNPQFSGCSDNLGGTDTVTTNSTNGAWKVTYVPSGTTARDTVKLTIPKAGATTVSSIVPSCVITVAPNGPATVAGAYDGKGTLTFTNKSIPTATNANCPGGATTGTATFSTALKSGSSGVPGYAISPAITPTS